MTKLQWESGRGLHYHKIICGYFLFRIYIKLIGKYCVYVTKCLLIHRLVYVYYVVLFGWGGEGGGGVRKSHRPASQHSIQNWIEWESSFCDIMIIKCGSTHTHSGFLGSSLNVNGCAPMATTFPSFQINVGYRLHPG